MAYTGKKRLTWQSSLLSISITAMMVACAVVLEVIVKQIPTFTMPNGGSFWFTCLPLILGALVCGPVWGTIGGALFGLIDFFLDGYSFNPGSFFFDYLIAFGAMGLAGFFAKPFLSKKWWSFFVGAFVAMAARYVSHGLSGAWFFASTAPEAMNPWFYSFVVYNLPYCAASLGMDWALGAIVLYPLFKLFGKAEFDPLRQAAGIGEQKADSKKAA